MADDLQAEKFDGLQCMYDGNARLWPTGAVGSNLAAPDVREEVRTMSIVKKPRPLMLLVREWERLDAPEPEQASAVKKAALKLERAVRAGKRRHIFDAANEFAKIFLKEAQRGS